ncbi:VOC family protein [Natronoglycomyces albus]|uniref:VOC family protein n=1 Tax=Natronoglycomyces albus TaxID=2811108 RepID=A0A895XRM9_9ACTN|nr:VOC family protein [Natronoglycomyces albus]QSB04268.1 VOC family protein [Natronoglycomyces albus]
MTTPLNPRFNFVGIVSGDLTASLDFYRLLGVDIPQPAAGEDHVDVTFDNGMHLAFDTVELIKSIHPQWKQPTDSHRIAIAWQLDTPAQVDELYQRMADAGFGSVAPWDAPWGQRYACLRDPDGNSVDLYAWSPSDGEK